jgi:hypothetical protein
VAYSGPCKEDAPTLHHPNLGWRKAGASQMKL